MGWSGDIIRRQDETRSSVDSTNRRLDEIIILLRRLVEIEEKRAMRAGDLALPKPKPEEPKPKPLLPLGNIHQRLQIV